MADPPLAFVAIAPPDLPPQRVAHMDAPVEDFASFVRARTSALLRTAFLLTGDQHLAEDLVQSALTRTHRAWRRLHESDHAEAYTRRAMYHLQVSWWRRRRLPESLSADLPEPRRAVSADEDRTVVRLAVLEALRQLSPGQRAVLVLRYFDDLSEAQAADVLGVSIGTVKSQTSRALNRLRADLADLAEQAQSVDLHERVLAASR